MGEKQQNNAATGLPGITVGIATLAILTTIALPSISDLRGNPGPENLYNCEIHTIGHCEPDAKPHMFDCLFTNNTRAAISPDRISVWNYDSEGILTDTSALLSETTVPPGDSARIKLLLDSMAHESVVCSVDPYGPGITRSAWTTVDNADG